MTMNLRFPGQYYDQETGLHYNFFRDYNPKTGRYIRSDPTGINEGLNTFAYAAANPLYWTDSTGLEFNTVTSWCKQNFVACVELGFWGSAGLTASTSQTEQLMLNAINCLSVALTRPFDFIFSSISKANKNKGGSNATNNPIIAAAAGGNPTPPNNKNNDGENGEQKLKDLKQVSDQFLKKNNINAHNIKNEFLGRGNNANYDIFVDKKSGQLWIFKKGGKGPGIPTREFLK